MSLTAVLIGCGRIGSTFSDDPLVTGIYSHASAYVACEATTLVAVCDTDENAAKSCAARWGVGRWFTDFREMLRETSPALVSICTPDHTHGSILEEVLTLPSVRGVLAEKPFAINPEDAIGLVKVAARTGVKLAVNHIRRYSAGHQDIRRAIHEGAIGPVQLVGGYYTKGILHNGTHWLDLARWLVGEPVALRAFHTGRGDAQDPCLDLYLTFETGARGTLLSADASAFSIFEMDIVGTLGRLHLYDSGHRTEAWKAGPSSRYSGYLGLVRQGDSESDMTDTVLHAVADLADCVSKGGTPRCSGADGAMAIRLAALAIRSAHEGRWVEIGAPA